MMARVRLVRRQPSSHQITEFTDKRDPRVSERDRSYELFASWEVPACKYCTPSVLGPMPSNKVSCLVPCPPRMKLVRSGVVPPASSYGQSWRLCPPAQTASKFVMAPSTSTYFSRVPGCANHDLGQLQSSVSSGPIETADPPARRLTRSPSVGSTHSDFARASTYKECISLAFLTRCCNRRHRPLEGVTRLEADDGERREVQA